MTSKNFFSSWIPINFFFLPEFRYQELLEQRLRERREKIARGEPVDDLAMEELPEDEEALSQDGSVDPKKLLEDLQKRFVHIFPPQ